MSLFAMVLEIFGLFVAFGAWMDGVLMYPILKEGFDMKDCILSSR